MPARLTCLDAILLAPVDKKFQFAHHRPRPPGRNKSLSAAKGHEVAWNLAEIAADPLGTRSGAICWPVTAEFRSAPPVSQPKEAPECQPR